MKPKFSIIIIISFIVLCLCLCSCQKSGISIDAQESFYSHFKIENNKVYIYCNILIKNPNKNDANIALTGMFDNDVKNGLLKEALLNGYSTDCKTTEFKLKKGDNWIEVVFIGDHASKNQKNDRLLPDIKIRELQ